MENLPMGTGGLAAVCLLTVLYIGECFWIARRRRRNR